MAQGLNISGVFIIFTNDLRLLARDLRARKKASYMAVMIQAFVLLLLSPVLLFGGRLAAASWEDSEGILRTGSLVLFMLPCFMSMLLLHPLILSPPDLDRHLMTPMGAPVLFTAKTLTLLFYSCLPVCILLIIFTGGFVMSGGPLPDASLVIIGAILTVLSGFITGSLAALLAGYGIVSKRGRRAFRLLGLFLMIALILVLQVLFDASVRGTVGLERLPLTWSYDIVSGHSRGFLFCAVSMSYLVFGALAMAGLNVRLWFKDPVSDTHARRRGADWPALAVLGPDSSKKAALIQKEVRILIREPELVTRFAMVCAIMVSLPLINSLIKYAPPTPYPLYIIGVGWGGAVVFSSNAFSMESGRLSLLKMTPIAPVEFVFSKAIVGSMFILTAGLAVLVVQRITLALSPGQTIWCLCLLLVVAVAGPLIGLGVSSVFSHPQKGSRYKPSFQAVLVLMAIFGVLFMPGSVLVSRMYLTHPLAPLAGVASAALFGGLGAAVGTRMALRRFKQSET